MDTPSWVPDTIFYEIFPDRFARSAVTPFLPPNLEPWDSPPTIHGFKGGDLRGIVQHLDYLEDLGITGLYLTPVFCSASNHRYHTYDYFNVDPLLGGNDALRDLLDAAHGRNMRVILDGVFNHASRGLWQFHHVLENGAASPYTDWFHFDPDRLAGKRNWGAYPTPEEQSAIGREGSLRAIGYQGWWEMPALPKFNTQAEAVRAFIFSVAEHWIRFGIDGWRLDVPGEIDDDAFWREFRQRVKSINPEAYLVGEIWHDARRWLQGDQFDATMNYLLAAACLSFFPGDHLDLGQTLRAGGYQGHVQRIDAREFGARIDSLMEMYEASFTLCQLNLLDSHDTPRFLTCASGDVTSLKMALSFIFTFPGAPCIFYGDEIGLDGGQDPDCRKAFPWNGSPWNKDLREYVRQLIQLRKSHSALREMNYRRLHSEDDVYIYARYNPEETVLVGLNASEHARQVSFPWQKGLQAPTQLLFGHGEHAFGPDALTLSLPPRSVLALGA